MQRQARNAEKYKQFRAEERTLKAQLLALRWQTLDRSVSQQASIIREQEIALEALISDQRSLETRLTQGRERQTALQEVLNQAQERHYQVGTEIARIEQTLEHQRQLRQRQQEDLFRTEQGLQQVEQQTASDQARLGELQQRLQNDEQAAQLALAEEEALAERFNDAEQAMQDWQMRWEEFSQRLATVQRQADVERTRIEQLERQQMQLQQRRERLRAEQSSLEQAPSTVEIGAVEQQVQTAVASWQQQCEVLAASDERIAELRQIRNELGQTVNEIQQRQQSQRGRLASLQTLQEAALQDDDKGLQNWLHNAGLEQASRLVEYLQVKPGWEKAVELVLETYLQAFCVDNLEPHTGCLSTLQQGSIALLARAEDITAAVAESQSRATLLEQVTLTATRPLPAVGKVLERVRTAPDLATALAQRQTLATTDSIITPEGIWLGQHWLRVVRGADPKSGMLARERELRELELQLNEDEEVLETQLRRMSELSEELENREQQRREQQEQVNQSHRQHVHLEGQLNALHERQRQLQQRQQALADELHELQQQLGDSQQELIEARQHLETALLNMEDLEQQRLQLEQSRDQLRERLRDYRDQYEQVRRVSQQRTVTLETVRSECNSLLQALQRLASQHEQLQLRLEQLQTQQPVDDEPDLALRNELEALLQTRSETDHALTAARQAVNTQDAELRQLEQDRSSCEQRVQQQREQLQNQRISNSESGVRRQTLLDQLAELDAELNQVLEALPADADEQRWQSELETLDNRIQRLGAINLAAIEEFEQLSERKGYLDSQNDDLLEALKTLENAIASIDKETRARFKETFERVNTGVQTLFPRLFGGGRAYLDLAGEDTLDAGVSIMAQPPGKRNGTIHLLSGGEKALTAVALIFSIFQLNPAPFCMLDEVDAPLDDANVGRFGELLQEMAEQVQFIVVSHNKGTMEIAEQLAGVTMQEPGVSRLVAVDIDEAVRLASA